MFKNQRIDFLFKYQWEQKCELERNQNQLRCLKKIIALDKSAESSEKQRIEYYEIAGLSSRVKENVFTPANLNTSVEKEGCYERIIKLTEEIHDTELILKCHQAEKTYTKMGMGIGIVCGLLIAPLLQNLGLL